MAASQNHNKLSGTSCPFPSLPPHRMKALASVVMSAQGGIIFPHSYLTHLCQQNFKSGPASGGVFFFVWGCFLQPVSLC